MSLITGYWAKVLRSLNEAERKALLKTLGEAREKLRNLSDDEVMYVQYYKNGIPCSSFFGPDPPVPRSLDLFSEELNWKDEGF